MLELFPEGFEERELGGEIELAAYPDASGEVRMRAHFANVTVGEVAEDWEERWREFHHGVLIGSLWVGPPWEQPPDGVQAVVIEPGRAFGTGAHATTRLCLELLSELTSGSLLDIGCGSGVLAVAGAKLGYSPVYALDRDPVAVETTIANAAANGVAVYVRAAEAHAGELPEVDTTVANLTLEDVRVLLQRGGSSRLVTSGYLATDSLQLDGRPSVRRATLDGWAADVWTPGEE